MTPDEVKAREQRGLTIAATTKLVKKGPVWIVPSQSSNAKYTSTSEYTQSSIHHMPPRLSIAFQ